MKINFKKQFYNNNLITSNPARKAAITVGGKEAGNICDLEKNLSHGILVHLNLYPAVWIVNKYFGLEGISSIFFRSDKI